jgi:hypothetical protein
VDLDGKYGNFSSSDPDSEDEKLAAVPAAMEVVPAVTNTVVSTDNNRRNVLEEIAASWTDSSSSHVSVSDTGSDSVVGSSVHVFSPMASGSRLSVLDLIEENISGADSDS